LFVFRCCCSSLLGETGTEWAFGALLGNQEVIEQRKIKTVTVKWGAKILWGDGIPIHSRRRQQRPF
jgi:hypothetical protein